VLYVANFAAFQFGWFSSVYGGAQHMPWLGPIAVLFALTLHFAFARGRRDELILVLSCAVIGAVFDSALVAAGWVQYPSGMFVDFAAPYWIIGMWMLFATTLNVSMRWLRNRQLLAAACGFVGGPIAYLTGQKLGGIVLVDQFAALLTLAVGWALLMPVLLWLASAFDGFAARSEVSKVKRGVVG